MQVIINRLHYFFVYGKLFLKGRWGDEDDSFGERAEIDESITLTRGKGAEFTGTLGLKAADYKGAVYIVSVETDGVICSESVESNIW